MQLERLIAALAPTDVVGGAAVEIRELAYDARAVPPVAAITGTNGKTTTAYLLWSILAAAGEKPGLLTNVERRVGTEIREVGLNTPESVDLQRLFREMLDAGNRACVMEATSMASTKGRLAGTRV